jgi:cytochrome b561
MTSPAGYSRLQITLHWTVAVLLLFQMATGDMMEAAWSDLQKGMTTNDTHLHVIVGAVILGLVIIRLVVRYLRGTPALPEDGHWLMDLAAKWTHWIILGLLVAIPSAGMAAWFGGVKLAADAHTTLFSILLALVLLHAIAALFHHYVLKDGLLRRMWRAG